MEKYECLTKGCPNAASKMSAFCDEHKQVKKNRGLKEKEIGIDLVKKEKFLGKKIHRILNLTLTRKLTKKEYTELVITIAGVFDLVKQ